MRVTVAKYLKERFKQNPAMQRKTMGILFIVIGFIVLAVGLFSYTLTATQTRNLALSVSDGAFARIELEQGDTVRGSLLIQSGNEGIKFYVEDPVGEVVYDGGTIYGSLDFSFHSQISGLYISRFENLSPTNQQSIEYSLTYSAVPRIVSFSAAIVGAGFFVAGIVLMFLKKKHA